MGCLSSEVRLVATGASNQMIAFSISEIVVFLHSAASGTPRDLARNVDALVCPSALSGAIPFQGRSTLQIRKLKRRLLLVPIV